MNRLLKIAQSQIADNKYKAIYECDNNLNLLRSHADWNKCEQAYRKTQVAIALSDGQDGNAKQQMAALKKQRSLLLKKYGLKENDLHPKFCCNICNDEGYVDGKRCKCLKAAYRNLLVQQSRVDTKKTFANSTEKDSHNKAVYRQTEKLCDGKRTERNFLLLGKTGTGKTYLLSAAANCLIAQEKSVMFVTAYSLNRQFLQYHTADILDKQGLLDDFVDVDVLIIDDLGSENILRNVTAEYLFALLNERICDRKSTYISTNLTLPQLQDRYDERIFSRLVDQNITFTAELVNSDKRIVK